jgi:hypothetical protein
MTNQLNKISIKEEKMFEGKVFPLTLGPPPTINTIEDTIVYLKNNMDSLLENLLKHGAILFRGFPVDNPKKFNDFVLSFGWKGLLIIN